MNSKIYNEYHPIELKELCNPLFKHSEIDMFGYSRYYPDNSFFALDTYGEWHDFLFQQRKGVEVVDTEFFRVIEHNKNIFNKRSKQASIFIADISPSLHKPLFNAFKIESFLWLVDKKEYYYEIFGFASKSGKNITNFYFNHYDILEKFMLYFNEYGGKIINEAEENKIIVTNHSAEYQTFSNHMLQDMESRQDNLIALDNAFRLKKYPIISENGKTYLTERESECLFYLLRGKTAKGIGQILGISGKTVENYVEKLKLKFSCFRKSDLISKSIEMGYMNIIPEKIHINKPDKIIKEF